MYAILGDIGGTNTRLALAQSPNTELLHVEYFENKNFQHLDQIIAKYLKSHGLESPGSVHHAAIAVAGPIKGDRIELTNVNFGFSQLEYKQKFGFKTLKIINDFTALAYCLPHMKASDLLQVGGGKVEENANKLVIGPGTGMGMAALIPCDIAGDNPHWHAIPSEAGHSTFSPNTEREFALVRSLRKQYYRVSIERLISGTGIKTIYDTLAEIDHKQIDDLSPTEITKRALDDADDLAVESLNLFCNILGRTAGDHCLHFSAFGGVYIAGGIVPKILPFFLKSEFRKIFEKKGRMADLTSNVATHIITHKYPALIGALASLD
ncbi:MAG: glucokinase [Rhizobiales bacterium]|nr:glucokinase [Hyphomicrobiales bacterium]NRB13519.1 glucokinase [Hyphomicrobiales bacterium]